MRFIPKIGFRRRGDQTVPVMNKNKGKLNVEAKTSPVESR